MRRLLFAAIFYVTGAALAANVIVDANAAARAYARIATLHSAAAETKGLVARVLQGATLGLYQGAKRRDAQAAELARAAAAHVRRAQLAGGALAALCALLLVALLMMRRRSSKACPAALLVAHLLGISALFLVVGLLTPILTVEAHGDVPVVGKVILQHDSQGILSTVAKLAATGNWFLALLLGLFSAVVPVAKLLIGGVVLMPLPAGARHAATRVLEFIGRWSMTDVLVVAVLLAFLAADSKQLTSANLGSGLYFFAAYGLLSIWAGHLMLHHRDELIGASR